MNDTTNDKAEAKALQPCGKVLAFYNPKSGVGTTTLAAHACALAHELGLRVAGVPAEWGQDLAPWLDGLGLPCIAPEQLAEVRQEVDLVVVDAGTLCEPLVTPDVWAVPIVDATSAAHACDASDRLPQPLVWIGNQGYRVRDVPAYLALGVTLAPTMPYSRALARTRWTQRVIWHDPELARSPGAAALRTTMRDLLERAFAVTGTSLERAVGMAHLRAMLELFIRRVTRKEMPPPEAPPPEVPPEPTAEPPAAASPEASPSPAPVVDAGLTALVDHVRDDLARRSTAPAGFTPSTPRSPLVAAMGSLRVDAWLEALHARGLELQSGLRTAAELADSLRPRHEVARGAGLSVPTVARFTEDPGGRRVETFVRLALALGREDLLVLVQRAPDQDGADSPTRETHPLH